MNRARNQQGKALEAAQTLEKLIRQKPAHAEAYGLLGQIYEKQRKVAEAVSVYRSAAVNEKLPEPQRDEFLARARALSGS